jgi:hypothetical protein
MHSHWTPKEAPRAFHHAKLAVHDMIKVEQVMPDPDLPSVDAFTATNLSKFSSTKTRIASERKSMEFRK